MGRCAAVAVLCLVVCLPAIASEPGEPMECSDFILASGISAVQPVGEVPDLRRGTMLSASGGYLHWRYRQLPEDSVVGCDFTSEGVTGLGLVLESGGAETLLAHLPWRCNPDYSTQYVSESTRASDYEVVTTSSISERLAHCPFVNATATSGCFLYNPLLGTAYVRFAVSYRDYVCNGDCTWELIWVDRTCLISGLPTLHETMQTYTPATGQLSFRVPYMPEGFQHANYFDTYWGDLTTVGDWNQAQPLQCGYPATSPSVGDYLTVEDTLPAPEPGQGYYYVTAVNYQGQRRYGRQANGGVLTGRDPAMLPGCN